MAYNQQCDPLQNNMNFPAGPPLPGMPGFNFDINFPTPPFPALGIPEDILALLRKLRFNLPGGGQLQEFVDKLTKSVSSILSNLLAYLNIFMGFLMFAMAIIELILCIIKVLCAFPKPWSIIRAVKRLLRKCLPIFISICFPWFAWLILLLSLIELLLALIQYIIAMIIRLIKQILKNLRRIKNLIYSQRAPNAALAVMAKVANFLCLFQVVFEFLSVIFALFDIITSQWTKILKVCDSGSSGGVDDDTVCAEFMKNPISNSNQDPETWVSRVGSTVGEILYCNEVYGLPFPLFPVSTTAVIRNEAVFIKDDSLAATLRFNNIIFSDGFTFFPFDKVITKDIEDRLKPYFVDLFITIDPNDGYGSRKIKVENVTVTTVITAIAANVIGSTVIQQTDANGYLAISGGVVVNDVVANGKTIEDLLRKNGLVSTSFLDADPQPQGYYSYTNIEYSLKINYEALAEYNLITLSCLPSVQLELGVLNTTFSKAFNFALPDFITLPDVGTAINNMEECLRNYRANITLETTDAFGVCMLNVMNTLNNEATNTFCQLLTTALDIHNMDIIANPALQFTNIPIQVKVTPKDLANRTIPDLIGDFDPPTGCLNDLADKFVGSVTLGDISTFTYDGYGNFVANINSGLAGNGVVTVEFNGDTIKKVVKSDDPAVSPTIIDYITNYTFVGLPQETVTPAIRRDESDTANNN